ncbi:MAG: hypothetical protein ACYTG1_02960 [Planctomycetota bacterium]
MSLSGRLVRLERALRRTRAGRRPCDHCRALCVLTDDAPPPSPCTVCGQMPEHVIQLVQERVPLPEWAEDDD